MINTGIALSIAAPLIGLILMLIGVAKAWPYRKTDKERFVAAYKPYKWAGLIIWIGLDLVGILLILLA